MFYRIKRWLYICLSVAVSLLIFIGSKYAFVTRLSAISGERVYYLDAQSSCALYKNELALQDIFRVKGECVRFVGEEENLPSLLEKLNAEILFTERAGGSVSYYCYAQDLSGGICINGRLVNVQIAFHGSLCAVGTPLIFDGF